MFFSICVYSITYIYTIFMVFLYQRAYKRKINKNSTASFKIYQNIYWFFLISIAPIILATIRKNVGADTETYRSFFRYLKNCSFSEAMNFYTEKGYNLLNIITGKIFDSNWGIFLTTSLIMMLVVFLIIQQYKKEISYPMVYLIFFTVCYHPFLNVMRQGMAAVMMVASIKYLYEKKYYKLIICILCAISIHTSAAFWAIILLVIYFIKNFIYKYLYLYIAICLISPIWIKGIFYVIQKFVIVFIPQFTKYVMYEASSGYGYYLYIVPPLLLILFFWNIRKNKKDLYLYALLWLQIPLQTLGTFVYYIERMSLYASFIQIILVPILIYKSKVSKKEKCLFFIIWYIFRLAYMEFYMNGNGTKIYQTIF